MSTSQAIRERIAAQPAGAPFTPALFAGLGSRASIDQALMRLTKAGFVERLGRGLYTAPRTSRFGLKTMPTPEAVAQTIAATEGATIEVHGAEAARRLGSARRCQRSPCFAPPARHTPCAWASCRCGCSTSRRASSHWPGGQRAKRWPRFGTSDVGKSRRPLLSASPPSCRSLSSRHCAAPRPRCQPG